VISFQTIQNSRREIKGKLKVEKPANAYSQVTKVKIKVNNSYL
jgi:hypothetical protein